MMRWFSMALPMALPMVLLLSLAAFSQAQSAESAEQAGTPNYQAVSSEASLNYLLHLPEGYEASDQSYPLLLFLHGIAQKGGGSSAALEEVAEDGPFRTIREGDWDESLPFIVVGPQSGGLLPWWQGNAVRDVLAVVEKRYRIDASRRYLTGISMGGRSTWWLAKNFSNEFAALIPVSSWAGNVSHSCEVFRGMGIWAFHGAKDPLIRLKSGRKPIDVLEACTPKLTPAPKITVLEDVGHGQWQKVYTSGHEGSALGSDGQWHSDIYRWLLTFKRRSISASNTNN